MFNKPSLKSFFCPRFKTYLGTPIRSEVSSAVVDVFGMKDTSLGCAEEQRNDPGYPEHGVRFVNRPPVVRQRITNRLKEKKRMILIPGKGSDCTIEHFHPFKRACKLLAASANIRLGWKSCTDAKLKSGNTEGGIFTVP